MTAPPIPEEVTRRINYTRPPLYKKQFEALFCPERYSIIEASTKVGKTVGALAWIYEKSLALQRGQNTWWVAPILGQAKIAYRRLKQFIPRGHAKFNEAELTVTTLVGSIIWFKSADNPNSLYGEDVYAAVIDEASRCKEEAWYAVRSTLTATKGPIRVIGNVHGKRNWAFRLARQAQGGERDMAYFCLTAYDAVEAGVLSRAEVEDARRKLPPEIFEQLYLARAADDTGNPFGEAAITACEIPSLAPGPVVAWGWDLAKSVDWTVGTGLNAQGQTAAYYRWQKDFSVSFVEIQRLVGHAPALIDQTGVGSPVVEGYYRLGLYNIKGFTFSRQSKQSLMEELAMAIQGRKIGILAGRTVDELMSYEYEFTRGGVLYSSPRGQHDDCVVSLALAVHCFNENGGSGGRTARFTYMPFI